ncbi:MAG: recombinase family protein [FCB group bacterium]|nr:recombinase family protein [FCB group bacterium]MBL7121996.1 recombinase family protein [Candidatus Neomarinimicrobiota bacterium]
MIRVSTTKQNLPRQQAIVSDIARRLNAEIVHSIKLKGISGTIVHEEPEFIRLMQEHDNGNTIDALIVPEDDRLIRSDTYLLFALEELRRRNIKLISQDGNPRDLGDSRQRLLVLLNAGIGGIEREDIQKRFFSGKERKRKLGMHVGGPKALTMGIIWDKELEMYGTNELMDIVRKMFIGFDNGNTNYSDHARAAGITLRSVRNILTNETYIGIRNYTEKRGLEKHNRRWAPQYDRKKIKRTPEEIIRVKIKFKEGKPPIDRELFDRVQLRIKNKSTTYEQGHQKRDSRFLFHGFIYCQDCQVPMYTVCGRRSGEKYLHDYYKCKLHRRKPVSVKPICIGDNPKRIELENEVMDFLSALTSSEQFRKRLIKGIKSYIAQSTKQGEGLKLNQEKIKIQNKLNRLADLYIDGNIPADHLKKKELELTKDLNQIDAQLSMSDNKSVSMIEKFIEMISETGMITSKICILPRNEIRAFVQNLGISFYVKGKSLSAFSIAGYKIGTPMGRDSWHSKG